MSDGADRYDDAPPERALLVAEALRRFDVEVAHHGLRPEMHSFGGVYRTSHCRLFEPRQEVAVCEGSGKGRGMQSEASAKFEALEHYTSRSAHLPAGLVLLATTAELEAQGIEPRLEDVPAAGQQSDELARRRTHWLRLRRLGDGAEMAAPLFVLDAAYALSPLPGNELLQVQCAAAATNSGTAIGCTADEALLHALNEQLERYSWGAALHEALLRRQGAVVRLLRKETLPGELREILAELEALHGEDVLLVDATQAGGIPAYVAIASRQETAIQPHGQGASVSRWHAIERALLELLQSLHFQRDPAFYPSQRHHGEVLERFRRWPALQRAVRHDLAGALCRGETAAHPVAFAAPGEAQAVPVSDQVRRSAAAAVRLGGEVLQATLYHSAETGVTCVRTYLPGLDNTWMLLNGSPVHPNQRAQERLRSSARPG